MAGGYISTPGDQYGVLVDALRRLSERLSELEMPTGTSVNSLVDQVQQAIADIGTTIDAWLVANSYTKAQIDSLVASPGDIAPGHVTASGDVTAAGSVSAGGDLTSAGQLDVAGPIFSPHGRATPVVTSYVSAWLNVDGRIGATASTRASKTDLEPLPLELAEGLLSVEPHIGRYIWDDPESPLKVFLIAEDVAAAGFGTDVVPQTPEGEPFTINYSQLVVPLLAIVRDQEARIRALEGQGVQ